MIGSESPTLEILAREPEGFSVWNGPPFNNNLPHVKLGRVPCTNAKYSENGSRLMVIKCTSAISIYDCRTSTEIRSFEIPSLLAAVLSPCGTYLQTFQKSSTPQDKNVVLWDIETGHTVFNQFQKNMSKTTWPSFHFSSDESISCRMATNEIQFFDGKDFSKGITFRLRVLGIIAALELSKSPGSYVAAFVPEYKGIPASVQIFSCEAQSQPVARKSFFRCSTVQLHWNYGSTGLLVVAQSDVDKTNQSYYVESKLNYLMTDGSREGLVSLCKEGPVHDVQWSSSGLEFAVVYGFMPAKATVFDKKCNPLLELGTGPYNTIRWNPKGRLICLAGFGNLPGDMAFWDFVGKKMIGATKAECSVTSEWSPDGRYFMTATTAPRLQIDNRIRIFHHNGSVYFEKIFDKLYQADWKPESAQRFRDVTDLVNSVSSLKIEETGRQAQDPKMSSASTKAPANVIQKPAAYRPPHAKGVAAAKAEAYWKPESAQRFRDITDLVNSVSSLKIEETGRQAQDPKTSSASTKAPANVIQKPAAYRPPHAKGVAAAKAEADWKPKSVQRFRDITNLVNSVSSLKIEETGRQAQDPKMSSASTKAPANVIQKSAAYRPTHAKGVAPAKAEEWWLNEWESL